MNCLHTAEFPQRDLTKGTLIASKPTAQTEHAGCRTTIMVNMCYTHTHTLLVIPSILVAIALSYSSLKLLCCNTPA